LALVEGGDGGPGEVGVHVESEGVGVEAGEVEGDRAGGQGGEGGVGAAGVGAGGVGEVCELGGVREDVGAGDAADPEALGGEGMHFFGVGEGCGEGRAERERRDGGGVGAGVTVDARCVRAGRDAGEGHVVVVGAVGVVVLEDRGNGGKEGGGARVEGVIDVGAHGAVKVMCGMERKRDCVLKWKCRPASFLPYMARWKAQTEPLGSAASGGAQT